MNKKTEQAPLVEAPRFFYFLVTGTIYAVTPATDAHSETEVYCPTLNVVIHTENPFFGMQCMADANNGLQVRYRTESGDQTSIIENVVINSVFPMGLMTAEEYSWRKPVAEAK